MSDGLKETVLSFNDLLNDIYGTQKRVSEILIDFGLNQNQIDLFKGEKLGTFYENIKFALECRFLHYSSGYRLLTILYRRYGLFGHKKETLEEIGDSMVVSRERVRQLQNKAIKRLVSGVSTDAVGVLLVLCACHTLELDAMEIFGKEYISINEAQSEDDKSIEIIKQIKPIALPKATFYISSSFNYSLKYGKYRMLIKCDEGEEYIEKQNLEGNSDASMILMAVIDGLETLIKPFDVIVYSNTLFGVSSIYKRGVLRQTVPNKASNYELKEKIRLTLEQKGHYLSNIADNDIKTKLMEAF